MIGPLACGLYRCPGWHHKVQILVRKNPAKVHVLCNKASTKANHVLHPAVMLLLIAAGSLASWSSTTTRRSPPASARPAACFPTGWTTAAPPSSTPSRASTSTRSSCCPEVWSSTWTCRAPSQPNQSRRPSVQRPTSHPRRVSQCEGGFWESLACGQVNLLVPDPPRASVNLSLVLVEFN